VQAMDIFKKKSIVLLVIISLLTLLAVIFSLLNKKDKDFIVFFSGAGMKIPVNEIAADFTDSRPVELLRKIREVLDR
jgi:ABC-type molybdate transport system substrate-binding protein